MKKNYRRPVLFVISCLSLLMSCYICFRINTNLPEEPADDPGALKAPLVSFANKEDGIRISWDRIPQADSYRVNRREKNGSWEVYDQTEENWYQDNAAEPGEVYYYRVYALNAEQTSKASETIKVLRLTKPLITDVHPGEQGVILNWDEVRTAGYYYVYRSTDGEKFDRISGRVKELTYVDETVEKGTTYYYCLKASNSNNTFNSVLSEAVKVDY